MLLFGSIRVHPCDKTPIDKYVHDKLYILTHQREMLANRAVHGFRVLHTNAFAFETLSKMAGDTNNPWMQEPAAKALATVTNPPAP